MTIDKRINYAWGGPGGKSPGTSASGGTRGGGGGGGRDVWDVPAPRPAPVSNPNEDRAREQAAREQAAREQAVAQASLAREEEARRIEQSQRVAEQIAVQKAAVQKAAAETQTRMSGQTAISKPVTPVTTGMSPGEAQARGLGAQHHGSIRSSDLHAENVGGPDAPYPGGLGTVPGFGRVMAPPEEWYGSPDETKAPVATGGDRIMDLAQRQRRADLSRIALQTDKSLTDVSDPKRGIMSNLMDTGKSYAKSAAPYMALNTLGLGALNPYLGIAKALGFDPMGSLMAKMPKGTGTKIGFQPEEGGDGGQGQGQGPGPAQDNVIEASIQEFSPEKMNKYKTARSQLQEVIDSGTYQGRQLTAEEIQMLQQKSLDIQKLIEQYLVNPEELGLARGGIAGLRG